MTSFCDICSANILIERRTLLKHCSHRFCYSCIAPKLEIRNCCPICKRRVRLLQRKNLMSNEISGPITISSPITDAQITIPMDDVESSFDMSFSSIADSVSKVRYYMILSFFFYSIFYFDYHKNKVIFIFLTLFFYSIER